MLRMGLTVIAALAAWSAARAEPLPRSTPEAQGIASAAVLDFVETADRNVDSMNSFMVVRHGKVIAAGWWAPYAANIPHSMYSLSKSFTSTAVGLAIAAGQFSLDDPILKFFPDKAPAEPSDYLRAMRVRDLLIMSTGHVASTLAALPKMEEDPEISRSFLNAKVTLKPGTHFLYNTPATYMLSSIVQRTTGQKVVDYLKPRLFDPLGIENPTWDESKEGVSLGGFGLSIKTEDIARFGLMLLNKGQLNGKQLVPAEWIARATAKQTSTGSNPTSDWEQGYGYQFWQSRHGFRGDGAFGQFCFVLPEQDAVIAITSGSHDMQNVMNIVWDKLLPPMQASALPPNEADHNKLLARTATLQVRPQEGAAQPKLAASLSGKRYTFANDPLQLESVAVAFRSRPNRPIIKLGIAGKNYPLTCGHGAWVKGRLKTDDKPDRPVAVSCAWTASDTLTAKIVSYETPAYYTTSLRFTPQQLFVETASVVWPANETHKAVGRAQ